MSVDAIDMSGKHEVDLDTNIWKVRCIVYFCFVSELSFFGLLIGPLCSGCLVLFMFPLLAL